MTVQKQSFSIKEFCEQHAISRSFFYVLLEKGEAPRVMKVGRRTLISAEAAAEWRKSMEHVTIRKQRLHRSCAVPSVDRALLISYYLS